MTVSELWHTQRPTIIAVVAALLVMLSTMIVVPEDKQAVIVRTGEPVSVVNRFRPNTRSAAPARASGIASRWSSGCSS